MVDAAVSLPLPGVLDHPSFLVNMAIALPTTLTIFFGIVTLYVISRLLRGQGNGRPLPPGPKGIPILGNINDMPKPGTLECHHWLQHKELYGAYNPYHF